jgi:hypothetical protein
MPAKAASSTPRPLGSITAVSEYWIVRSSRTMTAGVRMVLEKINPTNDVRPTATVIDRSLR